MVELGRLPIVDLALNARGLCRHRRVSCGRFGGECSHLGIGEFSRLSMCNGRFDDRRKPCIRLGFQVDDGRRNSGVGSYQET